MVYLHRNECDIVKKILGGINLTWNKLILFAIITGIYTAVMALLPITANTSFRNIAVHFEWWILFGIIIISNSKSAKDSSLKCFIFFLISQPLIYLIQVPFSKLGFELFNYYKYWFMWTLACLPMGYIGYYINKKNYLSMIILLPMLFMLSFMGCEYFAAAMESFPHHLLSFIVCYLIIIFIVLNLFDKTKLKMITFIIVIIFTIGYIAIKGDIFNSKFETYKTLDDYQINFVGNIEISGYSGTKNGDVEVISDSDEFHSVKITGIKNEKYEFKVMDESKKEYSFEYYYDENSKSVVVNQK